MPDYQPAPATLDYRPRLDRVRRADNPSFWTHMLRVVSAPDRTQPRSQEKYAPAIKDQGSEGSCTAHGGTSAAETCQNIAGRPVVPLSRMELYYDERQDEHDFPQDAGATVADSIDCQMRRGGLGPESQWPYDARPAEAAPAGYPSQRLLYISGRQPIDLSSVDKAINGFLAACDAKQPVVIGFDFYEEFFQQIQSTGVLAATPKSALAGGHEVFSACVYAPPNPAKPETGAYGLAGFDNSWGLISPARTDLHPDARAGMIWIPLQAFGRYVTEAHAVTPATPPAPQPTPTPTPAPESLSLVTSVPATGAPSVQVNVQASVSGVLPGDTALVVWNWGDGTANGAGLSCGHVYQAAGNYSVQAMAMDSQTGVHSVVVAKTIAIDAPAPPQPADVTIQSANLSYVAGKLQFVGTMSDGTTRMVP